MQIVRLTNVVVYYFYFIHCKFLEHVLSVSDFSPFGLMHQYNMQDGGIQKTSVQEYSTAFFSVNNGKRNNCLC